MVLRGNSNVICDLIFAKHLRLYMVELSVAQAAKIGRFMDVMIRWSGCVSQACVRWTRRCVIDKREKIATEPSSAPISVTQD